MLIAELPNRKCYTNTFTYTIPVTPEKSSYISSTSNLSYETDCTHTIGPISKVSIENVGKNYYSLPGFSTVTSGIGTGAILTTASTNIGSVKKVRIEDIGFNFQVDKTVRPTTALPQIVEINSQLDLNLLPLLQSEEDMSRHLDL